MFKSATSYLWGGSSSSSTNNNSNTNIKPQTQHQSTASLPDLDELHLEEKTQCNSPKSNLYHRHQSTSSIPFHPNPPSIYKSPPIDIILDKESKYKLSATSSISFLFTNKPTHNPHNRLNLYRSPFFIVSNRNARYLTKMDHILINNKHTQSEAKTVELEETLTIENTKESQSQSPTLSIINVSDLNKYLDSLNLTMEEKKGILTLCEWVKTEKLSIKLCNSMLISEIIITYFSSLSPTNPDLFGCWKKWIMYRTDHMMSNMHNINALKLKAFFDTGIFSIGFDHKRRPVWIVNTEYYDDSFGYDTITKGFILWVSSILWNLNKNEFDLFALRRGISIYMNLSHWSINMVSWNIIQAVKKAMVAYPFHLVDIYISNIPTFLYLLKQLAAKVVVPHAMEKVKVLADPNDYFEYAPKHKTPICAGGTLKVSATQWIKDRGFLDYNFNGNKNKHNKSPSAPIMKAPSVPVMK